MARIRIRHRTPKPLLRSVVSGVIAGVTRTVITWLLEQIGIGA